MTETPLRVIVAEDNDDLRDLLVTLIAAETDLECVGTATDVDGVVESAARLGADVIVLDLELQGRSSVEALRRVRAADPRISIIVFSGHSHPEMIRQTLAAGATAYVEKNGDYESLLAAIRERRQVPGAAAPDTLARP